MEALVIPAAGHVKLVDVREEYGHPPRDYRVFHAPRMFPRERSDDEPIYPDDIKITRLPYHRVGGGDLPRDIIAYWPSNWLDEWGVQQVCTYFGIKTGWEDYGASGYFVADSGTMDVRPVPGVALQRPETSSSGHQQTFTVLERSRPDDDAGDRTTS